MYALSTLAAVSPTKVEVSVEVSDESGTVTSSAPSVAAMTSLCFLHPLRPPGGATLARLSCPELGACSSPCSLAARRASSHAAAPSPVCELRAAGARSRARRASTGGAVCSSKSAPRPQTVPKAGASTASSSVADQRPFAPVPYLDLHNRAFASELSGRSPLVRGHRRILPAHSLARSRCTLPLRAQGARPARPAHQ